MPESPRAARVAELPRAARIAELIDAFNNRCFEEYVAGFHDDAVIEYPQSGERIEGSARMLGIFRAFAAAPTFEAWRIDGSADLAVLHAIVRYPGGDALFATLEYQFSGDRVRRETAYFAAPFEPAGWRAPFARVASFAGTSPA